MASPSRPSTEVPTATPAPPRGVAAACALMVLSVGLGYYGLTAVVGQLSGRVPPLLAGLATAAGLLVNGLAGPWITSSMSRVGFRRTVALGAVVAGGGLALLGLSSATVPVVLGFLALGTGVAATSYLPVGTALGSRHGAARLLGLAFGAGTAGGVVVGPALLTALQRWGDVALVAVGGGYAVLGVTLARLLVRTAVDRPVRTRVPRRPRVPPPGFVTSGVLGGVALACQVQMGPLGQLAGLPTGPVVLAAMPAAALGARLVCSLPWLRVTGRGLLAAAGTAAATGCLLLSLQDATGHLLGAAAVGASLGWSVLAAPLLVRDEQGRVPAELYARMLRAIAVGYAGAVLALPLALAAWGLVPSMLAGAAGSALSTAATIARRRRP